MAPRNLKVWLIYFLFYYWVFRNIWTQRCHHNHDFKTFFLWGGGGNLMKLLDENIFVRDLSAAKHLFRIFFMRILRLTGSHVQFFKYFWFVIHKGVLDMCHLINRTAISDVSRPMWMLHLKCIKPRCCNTFRSVYMYISFDQFQFLAGAYQYMINLKWQG